MKFYDREDACRCEYCENYISITYQGEIFLMERGVCRKHDILRKPDSPICDDFVKLSGLYTKKWHPKKDL